MSGRWRASFVYPQRKVRTGGSRHHEGSRSEREGSAPWQPRKSRSLAFARDDTLGKLLLHRSHLWRALQHLHDLVNRHLELVVDLLGLLSRRIFNPHIRRHAIILEVKSVVVRLARIPTHYERTRRTD